MASHLSMDERKRLSELREAGYSRGGIARALGRAKSTISASWSVTAWVACTVQPWLRSKPSSVAASGRS
jgi:hypothetical protein